MMLLSGKQVAVWESEPGVLDRVAHSLETHGAQLQRAGSLEELLAAVRRQDTDLVVAQLCACFVRPLELLTALKDEPNAPPVLMVSDALDVSLYLEAMRRGAFDCLGLPLNESELLRIATVALEAPNLHLALGGIR